MIESNAFCGVALPTDPAFRVPLARPGSRWVRLPGGLAAAVPA